MSFLKPITTTRTSTIQLTKPEFVVVADGSVDSLQETLARLKAQNANFDALICVLPLNAGMPKQERSRNRKLKDDNGKETGEIETYLSSVQYADSGKQLLDFEISEGNELYASMKFFETPIGSEESSSGESDDETETV